MVAEAAGGRGRPEGARGRFTPEQWLPTGPCTRTSPALVTGITRRQTLQRAQVVEEESQTVSSAIFKNGLID